MATYLGLEKGGITSFLGNCFYDSIAVAVRGAETRADVIHITRSLRLKLAHSIKHRNNPSQIVELKKLMEDYFEDYDLNPLINPWLSKVERGDVFSFKKELASAVKYDGSGPRGPLDIMWADAFCIKTICDFKKIGYIICDDNAIFHCSNVHNNRFIILHLKDGHYEPLYRFYEDKKTGEDVRRYIFDQKTDVYDAYLENWCDRITVD